MRAPLRLIGLGLVLIAGCVDFDTAFAECVDAGLCVADSGVGGGGGGSPGGGGGGTAMGGGGETGGGGNTMGGGGGAMGGGGGVATGGGGSIGGGPGDAGMDAGLDAGIDAGIDAGNPCSPFGATCSTSTTCCSQNCVGTTCAAPLNSCKLPGASCANANECCHLACVAGQCSSEACAPDNSACRTSEQCCSGLCGSDGGCTALSAVCRTSGNRCVNDGECCSHDCNNGACSSQALLCVQKGDRCSAAGDCCTGQCDGGLCLAPSGVFCRAVGEACDVQDGGVRTLGSGPGPEATMCGGSCCSNACAPQGPSGIYACAAPVGCRNRGETCELDRDCCGAAGSAQQGSTVATCRKVAPGDAYGRCESGGGCRPAGSQCRQATSTCSSENNCCAPNANSQPDTSCFADSHGVGRCSIDYLPCDGGVKTGRPCASSVDCCGLLCLPAPSDGGSLRSCAAYTCGVASTPCGADSDCCRGTACQRRPQTSSGVCATGRSCGVYGQLCSTAADCCDGLPCNGNRCRYLVP